MESNVSLAKSMIAFLEMVFFFRYDFLAILIFFDASVRSFVQYGLQWVDTLLHCENFSVASLIVLSMIFHWSCVELLTKSVESFSRDDSMNSDQPSQSMRSRSILSLFDNSTCVKSFGGYYTLVSSEQFFTPVSFEGLRLFLGIQFYL